MLENEDIIDLLGSLQEMSSEQLSLLIQAETAKESPNDELVLMALDILEDREKENPIELGSKGAAAWKKYQSKVRNRQRNTILIWKPMMQVASVLLVITLLFALLPTQANAETWWERLARWTEDFFSFFNPSTSELPENEYVFQTDNEGLQQVYDAVIKLGVTTPVVPMWLPEGSELTEIKQDAMPTHEYIIARFSQESNEIVYKLNLYSIDRPNQYHKNEIGVKELERHGTTYSIIRNESNWSIIWTDDNIECSIFIDCQENVLYEIIESIYRWRRI